MREDVALALIQTLVGVPRQLCRVLSHVHFTSCVRMIYSGRIMWRYRNRAWGGVGDGVSAGPGAHRGPQTWVWGRLRIRPSVSQSINKLPPEELREETRTRLLSPLLLFVSPHLFVFCPSSFLCFYVLITSTAGIHFYFCYMYWHKAHHAAVLTLMKACDCVPKDFL